MGSSVVVTVPSTLASMLPIIIIIPVSSAVFPLSLFSGVLTSGFHELSSLGWITHHSLISSLFLLLDGQKWVIDHFRSCVTSIVGSAHTLCRSRVFLKTLLRIALDQAI